MCFLRCAFATVACCALLQLALVGLSQAQRPDDVQAAAAAFAEGQRAQLRGDHARAAQLFELADRSAPSDAALRSAIRNYQAAGSLARAATLSLRARERYPDDAATVAMADEVLGAAQSTLGRLQVQCVPACSLAIDGFIATAGAVERIDVFVDPGTRRLVASWPDRPTLEESASVEAGGSVALELRADEVAVAEAEPQVAPDPAPDPEADPSEGQVRDYEARPAPPPEDRGVHWALFTVGAGLTAVGLGLSIWSGLDTLDARDAYVLNPTRGGYEDGVGREWRTNGLLIGTAVLGIATVVVAVFTDWGGADASEDRATLPSFELDVPSLAPAPGGASIALSGRFGGL